MEKDKKNLLYAGGRALPAVIRPYAHLVAGKPIKMSYDPYDTKRSFECSYVPNLSTASISSRRNDTRIDYDDAQTSVFFIPQYVYRSVGETKIEVSSGCKYTFTWDSQTLFVKHPSEYSAPKVVVRVTFKEQPLLSKRREKMKAIVRKRSKTPPTRRRRV